MKHIHPRLLLPLALAPLLLASTPRGTSFEFSVSEGATFTKTANTSSSLTLDDMVMLMNGEEPPMQPDITMSLEDSFSLTVTDEYLSMGPGRPSKLKRTFDTVEQGVEVSVEVDMMGTIDNTDSSVTFTSELEGAEVLFTWDKENEDFIASFPEDEGQDDLLKGLREDLDMRSLLPDGEVNTDDEWELDPMAFLPVLVPGGDLKLVAEDSGGGDDMMGMGQDMGSLSDWFNDDVEGAVTATFKGTRKTEDGLQVGVLHFTIKIENAVDMTEKAQGGLDELPDGVNEMEITGMDLVLEIDGEATLLWDLAGGHAHSFELNADLILQIDVAMDISAQGMELEIEQQMELSGSMKQTTVFE
jgi:hypothetical protein